MSQRSCVNVGIDLSQASEADLNQIKNEVLARLAQRAGISPGVFAVEGYDRHGSGHSRATPPVLEAVTTTTGG